MDCIYSTFLVILTTLDFISSLSPVHVHIYILITVIISFKNTLTCRVMRQRSTPPSFRSQELQLFHLVHSCHSCHVVIMSCVFGSINWMKNRRKCIIVRLSGGGPASFWLRREEGKCEDRQAETNGSFCFIVSWRYLQQWHFKGPFLIFKSLTDIPVKNRIKMYLEYL